MMDNKYIQMHCGVQSVLRTKKNAKILLFLCHAIISQSSGKRLGRRLTCIENDVIHCPARWTLSRKLRFDRRCKRFANISFLSFVQQMRRNSRIL